MLTDRSSVGEISHCRVYQCQYTRVVYTTVLYSSVVNTSVVYPCVVCALQIAIGLAPCRYLVDRILAQYRIQMEGHNVQRFAAQLLSWQCVQLPGLRGHLCLWTRNAATTGSRLARLRNV